MSKININNELVHTLVAGPRRYGMSRVDTQLLEDYLEREIKEGNPIIIQQAQACSDLLKV